MGQGSLSFSKNTQTRFLTLTGGQYYGFSRLLDFAQVFTAFARHRLNQPDHCPEQIGSESELKTCKNFCEAQPYGVSD